MRALIKSCIATVAAALLVLSLPVGAADSAKDKIKNEPLEKCKVECLNIKDAAAYESCMLKCNKTYETTSTVVPMKKK